MKPKIPSKTSPRNKLLDPGMSEISVEGTSRSNAWEFKAIGVRWRGSASEEAIESEIRGSSEKQLEALTEIGGLVTRLEIRRWTANVLLERLRNSLRDLLSL
jgi:hypothetical protein